MKKKKINEVATTEDLSIGDFLLGLQNGSIKRVLKKDLLKNICGYLLSSNINPDELYKHTGAGLSILIVNTNIVELNLNHGILLHLQRVERGNTTGSQFVAQMLFITAGNVLYRYGAGNGTKIDFHSWKKVALEAI